MNILLIEQEELTDNRVIITGDKLKHLRRILKVQVGDHVKVGVIGARMGIGTIEAISREQAQLLIKTDTPPPKRLPIHLILAIPRPIMLKRVLAQAASMGVERISLLRSKRVEKSFLQATIVEEKNYTPFLLKGIEQAVDTCIPEVTLHTRFRPFIEQCRDENPHRLRLIGHPQGSQHLRDIPGPDLQKAIDIAIGPEGGWIDYEVESFIQIGFTPFTMGERILRVDTAVPAILAQLELLQSLPA